MLDAMNPLYVVPEGVQTRWATAENPGGEKGRAAHEAGGRKGAPMRPLPAGGQLVLAEAEGAAGTVRRIWMTISDRSPKVLRGVRLDFYWDGAANPAVSAPVGDFFGQGLGRMAAFDSMLFSSPEARSFNCCIPMPFRTGMRIVATNESGVDLGACFYEVDYTIGDRHGADVLYFHAHYRRERETKFRRDYEILPRVSGKGRYLGCNLGAIANTELYFDSWWGEGEVKCYLDGDTGLPTLAGTGTEDYIGSGWGQGRFDNLFHGCPVSDGENMQYCFYRHHVPDPVYFHKDVRVTIQQIGCFGPPQKPKFLAAGRELYYPGPEMRKIDIAALDGYCLFEREKDDWSSCAYFYLDRCENGLPPIDPAAARIAGLRESADAAKRADV